MNIVIKYNSRAIPKTKVKNLSTEKKEIQFEPIYFQPPKCEIINNVLNCLDASKRNVFENKFLEIEQTFLKEFEKKYGSEYIHMFQSKLSDNGISLSPIEDYDSCLCILKIDTMSFDVEKDLFRLCISVNSILEMKRSCKNLERVFENVESEPEVVEINENIESELPIQPKELQELFVEKK